MFLLAGIPQDLQNYEDEVSQSMIPPSLPENFDEMTEAKRAREEYLYRCRLIHYHYVTSTKECNQLHYTAFTDNLYPLRGRLFQYAGALWEGETSELKTELIEVTEKWEELTGGEVPCPFEFDPKDLLATAELNKEQSEASRGFQTLQLMSRVREQGWVPTEHYEYAVAFLEERKKVALEAAESEEDREEIMSQWPWDDMDEEMYM